MHKNFPATTVRQRKLQFEQDDIWERLDLSTRNACRAFVTQLLMQVLEREGESSQRPRSENER